MRTLDLRGTSLSRSELVKLIPRRALDSTSAEETARQLILEVQSEGVSALRNQASQFDQVEGHDIVVPPEHLEQAVSTLNPEVRSALEQSIERVRLASRSQVPENTITNFGAGARVIQRWLPVERAGLYIPGGKAVYPSSVIMNVVPAQVAGVESLALVSPPQAQCGGRIHPTILAAAALLGIDEVYAIGGAGAIGALAYGVPELALEPVNMITGPGNAYVAAAKGLVKSFVGIDSEAGPTEILIIADFDANASFIAADLISQAEHDELASAVLVTDSPQLVDQVEKELTRQVQSTTHSQRVLTALNGEQSAMVLVDNLAEAINFTNAYAPEHLEIHTQHPAHVAEQTVNAGALFLGSFSPVSLGDYSAGSNHVLPTVGHSMFSSGLGAYTFLRPQQIVDYSKEGLQEVAGNVRALSDSEMLPGHGDAVDIRFEPGDN